MSPVGEAFELLGYLCEEDDGVPRRVWQQILVAVDHECGDGSGEQSGLSCCWSVFHSQRRDDGTENSAAYKNEYPLCARIPCFGLILVVFLRMR